jgi:hypothetical protein
LWFSLRGFRASLKVGQAIEDILITKFIRNRKWVLLVVTSQVGSGEPGLLSACGGVPWVTLIVAPLFTHTISFTHTPLFKFFFLKMKGKVKTNALSFPDKMFLSVLI